ncbi:hypothetical protein EJF36_12430 [Bacillus sp. HMF5848]|uniref:YfjL-like protein n=1 Tax=Bacillus sp. HMF5848 TaxID=2495421 RepID=UPI000F79CFD2|nr:hypothetical protein [Bacillus sp. HMF5848]RSK27617.1 hypothetical protein EJF36_12430 [Bacillus sp. HMF5848]
MLRKGILTTVVLLMAVGVGGVYFSFKGNPIELNRTNTRVIEYVNKQYPSLEVVKVEPWYNFKFNSYGAYVHIDRQEPSTFNIEFYPSGDVVDNYVHLKLEKEARIMLMPHIKEMIPELETLSTGVSLDVGNHYDEHTAFTNKLPVSVHVDIRWAEEIDRQQFIDKVIKVRDTLKHSGFNISNYHFSCAINQGKHSYSLSLEQNILNISKDELLNSREVYLIDSP